MKNITIILALMLAAMGGWASSAAAKTFTLRNDSNKKVFFGIAYWGGDTDKWVSKGWWNVEAGNSKQIEVGNISKLYAFAHEEGGLMNGRYWGGSEGSFCIDKASAYDIKDSNKTAKDACGGGNRVRAFTTKVPEVNGAFTWTVNNNNYISSHANICNQAGQDTWITSAMFRGSSGWKVEGWWKLGPGACKNFRVHSGEDDHPTTTASAGFNFFAKNNDNTYAWTGHQHSFCFDFNAKNDVNTADTRECSEANLGRATFVSLAVAKGQVDYNLTMQNAKAIRTTVNFQNQTGRKIWVARAYYPSSIQSDGWWTVEPNSTKTLTMTVPMKNGNWYRLGFTGTLYWAAHDEGYESNWTDPNGSSFCVDERNAYNFTDYNCTGESKHSHRFISTTVNPGVNTVNITEASAKKKTKIKLVNDMDFMIHPVYAGNLRPNPYALSSHGYYSIDKKASREIEVWRDRNVPAQGKFYFFANNFKGGEWSWGSDKDICIHYSKAFDYDYADTMGCQEGGQVKVKTFGQDINYGLNEVRFTAQTANPKTEIEVCNETEETISYWGSFTASADGPDDMKKGVRTRYDYIPAQSCKSIHVVDYNGLPYTGYYSYSASSVRSGQWTGSTQYCTDRGVLSEADKPECSGTLRKFRYLAHVRGGTKNKIVLNLKTADPTTFTYCNNTSKAVDAAVSYRYKTGFVSLGLGSIAAGTCVNRNITDQDGMPVVGSVYIYARSADGDVYTTGSQQVCVTTEKDKVLDTTQTAVCNGPDQKTVKARTVNVLASSDNRVSIVDADALTKTKVQFCNKTENPLRVALAYYRGREGFVSEGWIELPADTCELQDIGAADDETATQNVMVYGESGLETFGQGPLRFCVKTNEANWTLANADQSDCKNSSMKRVDATLIQVKKAETYNFDFVKAEDQPPSL